MASWNLARIAGSVWARIRFWLIFTPQSCHYCIQLPKHSQQQPNMSNTPVKPPTTRFATPPPMKQCTTPPPTNWKKHSYEQMVLTELHLQQILKSRGAAYEIKGTGRHYVAAQNPSREHMYRRKQHTAGPLYGQSCSMITAVLPPVREAWWTFQPLASVHTAACAAYTYMHNTAAHMLWNCARSSFTCSFQSRCMIQNAIIITI